MEYKWEYQILKHMETYGRIWNNNKWDRYYLEYWGPGVHHYVGDDPSNMLLATHDTQLWF